MAFSESELSYLSSQRLGRLATLAGDGTLQNNPVGFFVNAEAGTIDIGGRRMAGTRKFRNVKEHTQVAFVVDDLASVNPWRPRCLEIRGRAESLDDAEPPAPGFGRGVIRIHPETIFAFGLDPAESGMTRRSA
jgi:pyridoxamine 5'-phosphate oxidase family protein